MRFAAFCGEKGHTALCSTGPLPCRPVFQLLPTPVQNKTDALLVQGMAAVIFLVLTSSAPAANTWYVDNSLASSGNGQSWATAWTSLPNSGVSAGDTVYISGGTSSQTYRVSSWSPPGGTASNPIYYKVSTDTGHNGVVIVDGQGTWDFFKPGNYIDINGNVNGARHLILTNANAATLSTPTAVMNESSGVASGQSFRYMEFYGGLTIANCSGGVEFDHCKWNAVNWANRQLFLQGDGAQDGVMQGFVHDCEIWVVRDVGSAYTGDDGIACMNITVSNCFFGTVSIPANSYIGQASQHQDLIQGVAGQFYVLNSWFQDSDQYGIYPEFRFSGGNVHLLNNVFVNCAAAAIATGPSAINLSISDVLIANNLCVNCPSVSIGLGAAGLTGITFTRCYMFNNINFGSAGNITDGANVAADNLTSFSASGFMSYNSSAPATNNDFRLSSSATTAIGQGTNLSSYFTYDKDGNTRQATGNWDIGPYLYGASGGGGGGNTNPVPSVSPSSLNFGTVPANTTVSNYFTLQNTGGGVLSGTASVAAPFHVMAGGTYNLTNGQTQDVWISYTPSGAVSDSQTVTFAVAGGNAATATVSGSLLAVLPGLTFPSYAGAITAPFATNGGYVSQSVNTGVANGGTAVYEFMITNGGNYVISANVNAPNTGANSFYVNIDSTPTDPTMIWDIPVTSGFTNQLVSWRGNGSETNSQYVPEVFNLSSGTHQLIVVGREAGAQLGQISFKIWPPPQIFIEQ